MKTQLQAMRKRAGFKSAAAFAEHMGLNPGSYTNYEQGIRPFTLEQAWDFADVLGCSLDELAGRDWPPTERTTEVSPDERLVLDAMESVSDEGRARIVESASLVAESPRYTKAKGEDSDIQSA